MKLSLLVVHIYKDTAGFSPPLPSNLTSSLTTGVSLSLLLSFGLTFFSPLGEIFSVAIMLAISTMLLMLSMSGNALTLQINNLNTYDQNFISFKLNASNNLGWFVNK